ncbi:MAG: radical SAM protein [Elusimicrobia bacterium]|nr:radical SAM protein [Elusimicrobiota bacterium]
MIFNQLKDFVVGSLLRFTGSQKFLSIQLNITNACNLNCAHCYQAHHSNDGALDLPGWQRILDQYERLAAKLHLKPRFTICGGEPTLSPIFLPMLNELNFKWPGVRINVLTNATRLTQELAKTLAQFNADFQISLDGPDKERHDLIRGPGNFDCALAGLKNLQAEGLNAFFLATLSRRTSFWIDDFFETASRLKPASMNFTRFISQGNARLLEENHKDRALSGPELHKAYLAILKASKKTAIPTNTDMPLFHLIDPSLGANGKAGFQGLVVDYQGNLKVSSRTDFRLGNILEEGLENLFLKHPIMKALRDRKIEGCGICRHYEWCGGDRNASFAATESFLKKDPACWLDSMSREVS